MKDNENQFIQGISYSYINYIHEYLSLLNNSLYTSIAYLDEETFFITESLKKIYLELPDILNSDSSLKEQQASKILGYRETLERKYRALNAYQRELHHLMTLFNMTMHSAAQQSSEDAFYTEELASIDFDKLASDCVNFIFEDNKLETRQQRAALLLPYIPVRITRDNYLNYVRKSIEYIASDNHEAHIAMLVSILRQQFDGHLCPDYGLHFKDLSDTLAELKLAIADEDFYENAELLGETLSTLLDALHQIYKITGCLGNLLLFEELDFKTITDLHLSFYDFYYSVKNILLSGEDKELFLSELPEKVSEVMDQIQVSFKKVCRQPHNNRLFSLMETYLSLDVSSPFGFNIQKRPVNAAEDSCIFSDFLGFLKKELQVLPSLERKLRMQYFMSVIPFVMSDTNLYTYIKGAFEGSSDPRQKLTAVMYLASLLDENSTFLQTSHTKQTSSVHTSHFHHPSEHSHHHECSCSDH